MVKRPKDGKQHKMFKEKREKRNKNRTSNTAPGHNTTKPEARKKQTKTAENRVKRAYVVTKKPATTNSAKLEIQKWVKKNKKNKTNNPTKNREQEFVYNPLNQVEQASKTSKQPCYTATATCAFFSSKKCTKY